MLFACLKNGGIDFIIITPKISLHSILRFYVITIDLKSPRGFVTNKNVNLTVLHDHSGMFLWFNLLASSDDSEL